MPAHRFHPNEAAAINDPEDAIYFDDCEECERQAKEPVSYLEQSKLKRLWDRMLEVELGNGRYRTNTEAVACKALWPTYILLERHTTISPEILTTHYWQ